MVDVRARRAVDWRPKRLAQLRAMIKQADPAVVEEVKWRKPSNPEGVAVWSHGGIICVGNLLKGRLRVTFFKGAALKDPSSLFNAHLEGARRAIDLYEDDHFDEAAFKELVHNLPEQGTVRVTTSAHPENVVLTVENTGDKLTPQAVAALVEPFVRGTERIRTEHAGAGLGLAIVKSITHAHDGTLTLTPRATGGLCVTVQLPAAPQDAFDPANRLGLHGRDDV